MSQPVQFESSTAFINYPKQAVFGRTLPKNKIYEHSGANTRLKDLFVEQVEQIVWQYKLAPETINLPAKPGVPELQIFSIQLKTSELNLDVLRCIDGAVQFPIIFELSFDGRTKVIAAYKRPNESDASRWVLSGYFASAWLPSDCERAAMPLALDLGGLYEQMLHRLIPTPARLQESLADLVTRVELVAAKQREVEKAASRLAKEKQFNRKVEINAHLRQLKNELEELTGRESA
ncbi:DUF4391 domain-containing protein [Pectobacterium brasiliense]|uniref:DUF4391 domain-containing protein n=1 Tax=Enterobacterales TaxID=91347 RepID=UPI000461EEE4|nr:DUF4391 domain-containing protein [Kosakonia radicincitans]KDE33645.1 hypothetical protein AW40_26570 [Kosakonia radicincitans UMEnt01/12]